MEDDYTLRELGADEAKIFVNAVAVAGVSLLTGAVVSIFFPVTIAGALTILAVSNFSVFIADKSTGFEKKLIERVVNEFDK
ncbi:TPA: hypothetical protein ACX6QO_001912 [Photobacterium damselae]